LLRCQVIGAQTICDRRFDVLAPILSVWIEFPIPFPKPRVASRLTKGLAMIGKLLDHRQIRTTARSAHLASDRMKAAANRIADRRLLHR